MYRNIRSEAVVLSTRPYSEADKLITLFSRDFGKLTLLAKGVRRLKSRKRGGLEVFSHIKFSAYKGKGMPVITEVETVDNFSPIRKNLKKVSVAYFFVEIVSRATREEEKHEAVYELLAWFLKGLSFRSDLKKLRREFSIELAEELGFIPKGQFVPNPDLLLENIIERKLASVRVGKKLQV